MESERFKSFTCDELTRRDKVNLDIFWLKDDAIEESANLPAPEIIAADITADLEAAMEQFAKGRQKGRPTKWVKATVWEYFGVGRRGIQFAVWEKWKRSNRKLGTL